MGAIQSLFKRVDAGFLITLALTIFSGVYLTKTGVSPIYGTTAIGLSALACWHLAAGGAAPLSLWAQALCTFLLAGSIAIHQLAVEGGAGNVINLVLGPILGALIPMSGRRLDRGQLVAIAKAFVVATLAVASLESAYRFTHPDLGFLEDTSQRDDAEDLAFYAFKFNSLMYIDSNFVGLQLAVLFGFLLGLSRHGVRIPRLWYWYCFALVALTLSRASVFTVVALLGLEVYRRWSTNVIVRFLMLAVFVVGASWVLYLVQNDISFQSKFEILHRFTRYLGRASTADILFGIGAGHAKQALSIGAHNLVVTYVVELGLLVSILLFGYWITMATAVPSTRYMVMAWLINGFSLTTLAIPYMYASAAMLLLLGSAKVLTSPAACADAGPGPER